MVRGQALSTSLRKGPIQIVDSVAGKVLEKMKDTYIEIPGSAKASPNVNNVSNCPTSSQTMPKVQYVLAQGTLEGVSAIDFQSIVIMLGNALRNFLRPMKILDTILGTNHVQNIYD